MWSFLFWIFGIICLILLPFLISMLFWFLHYYFKHDMRFKKGEYHYVGYGSKLKRLFIEFPKQFILDKFKGKLKVGRK